LTVDEVWWLEVETLEEVVGLYDVGTRVDDVLACLLLVGTDDDELRDELREEVVL